MISTLISTRLSVIPFLWSFGLPASHLSFMTLRFVPGLSSARLDEVGPPRFFLLLVSPPLQFVFVSRRLFQDVAADRITPLSRVSPLSSGSAVCKAEGELPIRFRFRQRDIPYLIVGLILLKHAAGPPLFFGAMDPRSIHGGSYTGDSRWRPKIEPSRAAIPVLGRPHPRHGRQCWESRLSRRSASAIPT